MTDRTRSSGGFANFMGLISWFFPLILLGISGVIPALQQPIEFDRAPSSDVYGPLLVLTIIGVVWLTAENIMAASRNTTVRELQRDHIVSLLWATIILTLGGYLLQEGLQWFIVVPWFITMADAFLSGYLGINNAAQKPLVESGGHR
jgi:hypothetical protein